MDYSVIPLTLRWGDPKCLDHAPTNHNREYTVIQREILLGVNFSFSYSNLSQQQEPASTKSTVPVNHQGWLEMRTAQKIHRSLRSQIRNDGAG
jgi:hypothetical protein